MLKSSIFAFVAASLICRCYSNEYKEYNFDVNTKCRVIGEEKDLELYENKKNPSVLSYSNFFFDIDGAGGHNLYTVEYCECYTETGNCRLATGFDKNDSITVGYSRAIIEFEMDKKDDIKNETYDSLFKKHQTEFNLPSNYKHNKDLDEIFFSNIYETTSSDGNTYIGEHAVYESVKDVIDKNYKFPIYYTVNKTEEGSIVRVDTKTTVKIGEFKVASIIECLSYYDGTQQVSKKNIYGREGFKINELDCTWVIKPIKWNK